MWKEGEHLHFFSRGSFERLTADAGFRIADFRHSPRFVGSQEFILQ
jgi:hypothetical protein